MTTFTDLRDAIAVQIDAVSGVENVFKYTRYVSDWQKFLDLFRATTDIRGWWITLANPSLTTAPSTFGTREWTYHFLITGILGVKDASNTEEVILLQAEAILAALSDETTFGVSGVLVRGFDPQIRVVEHRTFGSVLAHYVEIVVDIPVDKGF